MFTIRTLTVIGMVLALTVSAQAQGKKGPAGKNHAKANGQKPAVKTQRLDAGNTKQIVKLKGKVSSSSGLPYAENDILTKVKQTKSGSLVPEGAPKSAPAPKGGAPKRGKSTPVLFEAAKAPGSQQKLPPKTGHHAIEQPDRTIPLFYSKNAPKTESAAATIKTSDLQNAENLKSAPKSSSTSLDSGDHSTASEVKRPSKTGSSTARIFLGRGDDAVFGTFEVTAHEQKPAPKTGSSAVHIRTGRGDDSVRNQTSSNPGPGPADTVKPGGKVPVTNHTPKSKPAASVQGPKTKSLQPLPMESPKTVVAPKDTPQGIIAILTGQAKSNGGGQKTAAKTAVPAPAHGKEAVKGRLKDRLKNGKDKN